MFVSGVILGTLVSEVLSIRAILVPACMLLAAVLFLLTQDLQGRMVIEDRWTGVMLLVEAAALLTDFICLRYRGER